MRGEADGVSRLLCLYMFIWRLYPNLPKRPSGRKLVTKIEGNIYTGIRRVQYDIIDDNSIYAYGGTYENPYKEYLITDWVAGLGINVSYRAEREVKTNTTYYTYEYSDYYVYGQDIDYTLSTRGRLVGYYDDEVVISSEQHSFEYISNVPIKGIYKVKNVTNIEYENVAFPINAILLKNKKHYQVIAIETGYYANTDYNKKLYYVIYDKDDNSISRKSFEIGDIIFVTLREQNSPKFFTDWILENTTREGIDMVLYKNSAEHNRVDKTNYLIEIDTIIGTFREPFSLTGGSIIIQLDAPPTFNYVYMENFERYYFVTDVTVLSNSLYEISLSVDVLMSFKDAILNLNAFVDRNEFATNPLLIDKNRVIEQGYDVETVEIENQLIVDAEDETPIYILSGMGLETRDVN